MAGNKLFWPNIQGGTNTVYRILLKSVLCGAACAADVPAAYRAQWNEAVNAGIDARIEKFRKADAAVEGLPASVEVKVEQVGHAFQFGSHIFNFDQLGRDDWNAQYRATFTNLWNAATVGFYWDRMEPTEGEIRYGAGPRDTAAFWKSAKDLSTKEKWERFPEYRRPAPDPVLDFLDAHGLSAHGHPMIYPPFQAPWVTNGVDRAGLAARYARRIRQLGAHYGARLDQWDVVNETVDRSCSMAGPYHVTRKADAAGRIAFRGFKGRYRLSWTDADGRASEKFINVK